MTLEGHAEVMKLARLLGTPLERLAYLEMLAPADVRLLRERATDSLYAADGHRFHRVALASRLPPVALTTFIAQHAFGPLLCARVAGLLDTRLAVEIANRLPTPFVADLAVELDPRRARDLIASLPPERIAEVAAELTIREEYIVMGRFVEFMTDAAVVAAFGVIDDASLLRISYFVEAKDHLDHVVGLLEEDRLRGAIRIATAADTWPQALDLLTRVSPARSGALADLAALEPDSVLDGMVATAQRDGLWDDVLPVTREMSGPGRARFASLRSLHAPEVLGALVRAATADDLWLDLLPLARLLPPGARSVVWSEILSIAAALPPARLRAIVGQALDLGIHEMLGDLVDHVLEAERLSTALRLAVTLGPVLIQRLAPLAAELPADQRAAVLRRARALRLIRRLGPLGPALAGAPPGGRPGSPTGGVRPTTLLLRPRAGGFMTEFTPVASDHGAPEPPPDAEKRILVAAVGNQWLQDDGFGPAVAKLLLEREMPKGVVVIDFGTGGLNLAYEVMAGYDVLILIDITRQGHEPGTLYTIEPDEAEIDRQIAAGSTLDLHGMDPNSVLRFVKQVSGSLPARMLVIACEPELVVEHVDEMDMGLSDTVQAAVVRAVDLTLETIDDLRAE